jgi:phosphocarrier protein HPr
MNEPQRREVTIVNRRGLHARASARFVKCAERFKAEVRVTKDGQSVGGTSIMGLMTLAAAPGSTIQLEAEGPQATEALEALSALIAEGFGETD